MLEGRFWVRSDVGEGRRGRLRDGKRLEKFYDWEEKSFGHLINLWEVGLWYGLWIMKKKIE